jgi:C-terminal processing protease CtpA/Prc
LSGDAGSEVSVRVLRSGAKPQTIKVVRGKYAIPQAEARVEAGKVGVIKVYSLEDGEANDIQNAGAEFDETRRAENRSRFARRCRRKFAGSVSVANLFIKDGDLAKVIGRENKLVKTFTADPSKAIFDGKLVALIDLGTAGAVKSSLRRFSNASAAKSSAKEVSAREPNSNCFRCAAATECF